MLCVLRPAALLRRTLVVVHRWLGVALSLVFLLWFLSGIVMMYWTFPEVGAADRLARAPVLDPARVNLPAWDAAARFLPDEPVHVLLTSFDGRPVYRVELPRGQAMVYADDGSEQRTVDAAMVDRAAAAWTGLAARDARKASVEDVDQWTVAGGLRSIRPLYKYSWQDGQQVYVDGRTAAVVQYTTTASRTWAYLGAIPHWLYFTPLRQHQPEWFATVVWSSAVGTVAALIGLVLVAWMYSPRKRYRYNGVPTGIPYRGWKRWHAIAGILFGVVTTTWTFSGMLSMGPFPLVNRAAGWITGASPGETGGPEVDLDEALLGNRVPLSAYAGRTPADALRAVAPFEAREVELTAFAGEPFYLATNAAGDTRLVPVAGAPRTALETAAIMRIVRDAAGPALAELRVIDSYDAYYRDRRRTQPLPVVYARLDDGVDSRYYIDPRTGRVIGRYDTRSWASRWLYQGLHSLDFPWLYARRPLWDIVVIVLMLGGTTVCLTSLVLAWRVLSRKVHALIRSPFEPPDDDLAPEERA
ncbi:MAG: hypothetical protein FJW23_09045 [Acidimicrobiia bacterium]|nr:hypothetical protein [Acidimicrobiia bacterium]